MLIPMPTLTRQGPCWAPGVRSMQGQHTCTPAPAACVRCAVLPAAACLQDTDDIDFLLSMSMSEFGNCIMQLLATIIFIAVVQVGASWAGSRPQGGIAPDGKGRRRHRAQRGSTPAEVLMCTLGVSGVTTATLIWLLLVPLLVQPWILVGIGPLAIVYYFLQKYYRCVGHTRHWLCPPSALLSCLAAHQPCDRKPSSCLFS